VREEKKERGIYKPITHSPLARFHPVLAVMPKILIRFRLERFPAIPGAEVVSLTLIYKFLNGGRTADFHAANRILEAWFIALMFHHCLLENLVRRKKFQYRDRG